MKRAFFTVGLLYAMMSMPSQADQFRDVDFLEMVGAVEGPDGYDSITGYAPFHPPHRLTRMTVAEVLDYQDQIRSAGAESTAVGRYQFIRGTLGELVRDHNINEDRLFDGQLQDRLARIMMARCDFYSSSVPTEDLANCLAGVWAALPMASGDKKGRSRYQGVAGNRNLVDLDQAIDVLESRLAISTRAPARVPTISLEEAFRQVELSVVAVPLRVSSIQN